MKLYFIIWLALMIGTGLTASAQKHPAHLQKRESIKVYGGCKCSKPDIENAAREAGASFATFDSRANTLIVAYDLQRTNGVKIRQHIEGAGYDTRQLVATREPDAQLPDSSRYFGRKTEKRTCCER